MLTSSPRQLAGASVSRIRRDVEALCSNGSRHSGENPDGHASSVRYIEEELQAAGCSVERQGFTIPAEPDHRPGVNVVGTMRATIPGPQDEEHAPGPALLIGSHFDTVPGSPGADDNASGVAGMLECARAMAASERHRPLIFACFDAEERQPETGLHGSRAYVQQRQIGSGGPAVSAAIILEMIGYSAGPGAQRVPPGLQLAFPRAYDRLRAEGFAGNSVVVISNWKSRVFGRSFEAAAAYAGNGLPVLAVEIPRFMPVPRNLRRSDHASFWDAGVPAVMIGDTANFRNPHYHSPTDRPETLDYALIEKVTNTVNELAWRHVAVTGTPKRSSPSRRPRRSP